VTQPFGLIQPLAIERDIGLTLYAPFLVPIGLTMAYEKKVGFVHGLECVGGFSK
jgi:hypothetical protein